MSDLKFGRPHFYWTSDGMSFHFIGDKRDLYSFVARVVREIRFSEPGFLLNKCVYDLKILDLYKICKTSGIVLVKLQSMEEDLNGEYI